jgi:hypothetical protein
MNQMFFHKALTQQQKHGIIVNLQKNNGDKTPNRYRPITLMNTDYKILTGKMARRLNPIMQEQITTCQYSAVPVKTIMEAVATI